MEIASLAQFCFAYEFVRNSGKRHSPDGATTGTSFLNRYEKSAAMRTELQSYIINRSPVDLLLTGCVLFVYVVEDNLPAICLCQLGRFTLLYK